MAEDAIDDAPEDFAAIADQFSAGVLKNLPLDKVRDMVVGAHVQGAHGVIASVFELLSELAALLAKGLVELEEPFLPVIASFVAPIVGGMFGTDVNASTFATRSNREGRGQAAAAIVEAYMGAITGGGDAESSPTDAGAKRIASAAVHATLEGSFQALITELCSDVLPLEIGHFEALGNLPEDIIRTLGVSRLVRRAFAPLIDATAATPMKWKVSKDYRQNLHSPGDAVDLFLRGKITDSQLGEELARQGFSDERIEGLKELHSKPSALADMLTLVREGLRDRSDVVQKLLDQGWDNGTAELVVSADEIRRTASIRDDAFGAVRAAYVDRRIDDAQLSQLMPPMFPYGPDLDSHTASLRTMRDLNTKRLSPEQAKAAVLAKVLPIAGYRDALRLDGYDEDAVLTLELMLEVELNSKADVEKLRKQKEAEAAAAKQAAADAAKQRADDVEAARVLARRGSLAQLQRAVVRGLIPTSRYAEVLTPQYDADTVATLVGLVEQDRADFVAQQQKAEDAAKRAAVRHIDVGALTAAYLNNVLTLDQVGSQLAAMDFPAADADVLLATMRARKADLDAAKQQRADAAAKAKTRSIDLGKFETLVRRGHRTPAEYAALLTSLGFDAGSVAAMGELLQLQIADDTKARDERAAAAAKASAIGPTLEQMRRAVILGIASVDDFQTYLVKNKYTVDAQSVLLAELRAAVTEAEAARAKRTAATGATVETRVPLATVARAARLGIVAPDVYEQRLIAAGYTDDDVSIELDLLAVEIADTQAARAKAAAAEAATADRGLSLDQVAKAVKLGAASIDDYRSRAIELKYSADDVDLLVAVLEDEEQAVRDAEARHATIDGQLKARNLSLSELDAAVKAGQMTVDAYTARLRALGYGADDADLLTTLLLLKLPAAGPGA